MNQLLIVAVSLAIASSLGPKAHAQDACVALANAIVYNQTKSFSLAEQREINRADLCSERYKKDGSSKSAKIEASYKFFSGGAAGSESQISEEQARQCDNKFGDFWSLSISSSSARTASADSLSVIGECLQLDSAGIKPKMTMTNDGRVFSFSFHWRPNTGNTPLRLDYAGPTSFTDYRCSAQSGSNGEFKTVESAADVRTSVPPSGSFTINCERPLQQKTIDGETLTCYAETLLSIASNGPSATLKVPEVCTPSMPGQRAAMIESRLTAIEAALRSVQDAKLPPLENALKSLTSPVSDSGNFCSSSGRLQICWGKATLIRDPNGPHTAAFSFRFARPFRVEPTVTNGINISGSGHAAGVYSHTVTTQNYIGRINNMYIAAPIEGRILMQYIAIGEPE